MKHWSGPEAVVPGVAPNAALHAASVATSSIDRIAERTDGKVPERLDEALQYAVARIEQDPQNVAAIVRHLGWDGLDGRNVNQLDAPVGLPRERLQGIVNRAIDCLRADGMVPEVVERSIALVERSVPILDMDVCKALLNARLCYVRLSCGALASAAAVFRNQAPFEVVRVGLSEGLVKSGTSAESTTQLAARAQDLMRSRGCANMMELADDAREIFGSDASRAFIEAAIRTVARFEWLNQETGWFWYTPDRGLGSNRLVNQIRQILAVTQRIQLAELRSAIGRDHCLGNFAPPPDVLASICRRLLFAHIEGDAVTRVPGVAQWNAILGPNETTVVNVLQAHGPVLGGEAFLERCREGAMSENAFKQIISRSVILKSPVSGMYALVGATVPPRTTEAIKRTPIEENAAMAVHGILSDGRIFLAWKLDSSTWRSGALRVPEPVNTFVEGEFRLKTITNRELGCIQIFQRACWDVRRLLQYACSDTQDTLVLVLGLRDRHAIGILGDEAIVAQVRSGFFDLDTAPLDADGPIEPIEKQADVPTSPSIAA